MQLGIFGDQRYLYDAEGNYYSRGNLRAVLLDEYARHFERVLMFFRTEPADLSWAPRRDLIRNPRVEFVHLPTYSGALGFRRVRAEIARIIARRIDDCDLCIMRQCYQVSCVATPIARRAGKPLIAHLRGDAGAALYYDVERLRFWPVRALACAMSRRHFRRYINQCDVVLGTSKAVADQYADAAIPTAGVADGCTTGDFFLPFRTRAADEPCEILVVARINFAKNVQQLVRALAVLRGERRHCTLTIVGDGPYLARLQALARRLHVEDSVALAGRVDSRSELVELFRRAHIGALTSLTEGLPSSVLESMAASLPIVATALPCMHEIVSEGENGFLVGVGDVAATADRLARLIDDESLRQRLGQRAHERAKDFRTDRQVARLAKIAEDLLARRNKSRSAAS